MANDGGVSPEVAKAFARVKIDMQRLALELDGDGPRSLREVLDDIETQTGRRPAAQYPQGLRYLVDGFPALDGRPGSPGFGDRPFTELREAAVQAHVDRVREFVGYRITHSGRELADPDEGAHGYGAAEQTVRAARWVSHTLVKEGWLTADPLLDLPTPHRVGATRDQGLTDEELCDFCSAVLRRSRDMELTALVWPMVRVSAIRRKEALGLHCGKVQLEPGYFTVLGKGHRNRHVPMHRPVLAAALARARRWVDSDDPGAPLWPTPRGSFSRGSFTGWSSHLKDAESWARGHEIGPHMMRHTTARVINERYPHSDVAALYLGEKLETSLSTVAAYIHSPYVDDLALRRVVAEEVFGPLDSWPRLPESPVLQPIWNILGSESP